MGAQRRDAAARRRVAGASGHTGRAGRQQMESSRHARHRQSRTRVRQRVRTSRSCGRRPSARRAGCGTRCTRLRVDERAVVGSVRRRRTGVARAARDWFAQWAAERTPGNLGAPLASLPAFQQTLGRIDALLFSNRVLLDASAHAERVTLDEAPLVKYTVTNQAIEAVQLAIEASGNPGLSRDNAL